MSTITNETAEPSLGAYFVRLFKVDADQFQLLSEKPQSDRGCEFLNRPYELERLDAVSDSRRSLAAPIGCEYPIECPDARVRRVHFFQSHNLAMRYNQDRHHHVESNA